MSIEYQSLDARVRSAMTHEVDRDQANGVLYLSPRLTEEGVRAWPRILREACEHHDDSWLADTLRSRNLLQAKEQRRLSNGKVSIAQVPNNAAEILAEGEFNRCYARGLCVEVLACGEAEVEVCRGKDVENPRPESQAMIGRRLPASALLDDLRTSQGIEPALGLPKGPNSGLTVRRPTQTHSPRGAVVGR